MTTRSNGGGTWGLPEKLMQRIRSYDDYSQAIVAVSGGDYTNIQSALNAGAQNILVKNGSYNITDAILASGDVNFARIRGESRDGVILKQTNASKDVINIQSPRVSVENMTIDARGAQAAFVAGGKDYIRLMGCRVYGSDSIFAVYFSGPDGVDNGQPLLDRFYENKLPIGYECVDNIIHSTWAGDNLAFCLTKEGTCNRNTVIGGRIAFYMCRDSDCNDNISVNSSTSGIFVSLPKLDCRILRNKVRDSLGAGIQVKAQYEHPISLTERFSGISIHFNDIFNAHYLGMDIDQLKDSSIIGNRIERVDHSGISLLRSDDLEILGNEVYDPGMSKFRANPHGFNSSLDSGIFVDWQAKDSRLTNNWIRNQKGGANHAIRVQSNNENGGHIVENNTAEDIYLSTTFYFNGLETSTTGNTEI